MLPLGLAGPGDQDAVPPRAGLAQARFPQGRLAGARPARDHEDRVRPAGDGELFQLAELGFPVDEATGTR